MNRSAVNDPHCSGRVTQRPPVHAEGLLDALQCLDHVQFLDALIKHVAHQNRHEHDEQSGGEVHEETRGDWVVHAVAVTVEHVLEHHGAERRAEEDADDGQS